MSTNGPAVVTRMRAILREDQTGRPVYETAELREAVNRHAAILAMELGLGTQWVTPITTLVAGTQDYTLSSTYEYLAIKMLRFADDGTELPLRSLAQVMARREGSAGPATGRPQMCALRPTEASTLVLAIDTDPDDSYAVDALVSYAPLTWDASDTTPPTYYLSEAGARALELRACASVVETSGPEKRNALAISADAPKVWQAEAARLVKLEEGRIISMKRSRGQHGGAWFFEWASS